ncbi:MAG: hypothetical protein U1F57_05705 [bacterium]
MSATLLVFLPALVYPQEFPHPLPSLVEILVPPQAAIDGVNPPPKTKELKAKEIDLQIETPPGTKVSIPLALRSESNSTQSDYRFLLPVAKKKVQILVEGPFGGKLVRELNLNAHAPRHVRIEEKPIEGNDAAPSPALFDHLPELCPRLQNEASIAEADPASQVDRSRLIPEKAVYEGKRDLLALALPSTGNTLLLESAVLRFDYEDPSVLVGFNSQTGEAIFEKSGGFYSNLHYFVFSYRPELEKIYRGMESDFTALRNLESRFRQTASEDEKRAIETEMKPRYEALYGKGDSIGPYQILLHSAFQTLKMLGKEELETTLGIPQQHGFIPGPFLGSRHWGYNLCEWGDTAYHAPEQKMLYRNYPLWRWNTSSLDEKVIIMVVEGDEQLKKNGTRKEWEKTGVLRPFDYADDLVAFFVISRGESQKPMATFSSPLRDFSIQARSP